MSTRSVTVGPIWLGLYLGVDPELSVLDPPDRLSIYPLQCPVGLLCPERQWHAFHHKNKLPSLR